MWLTGAMVCLLTAPWVQLSVIAGNGWPHQALRHHWLMPISCHFQDCKALLVTSLTHVSGAIASIQTSTSTSTKGPTTDEWIVKLGGNVASTYYIYPHITILHTRTCTVKRSEVKITRSTYMHGVNYSLASSHNNFRLST